VWWWGGGGLTRSEIRPVFDFVFQVWLNFLTVGVGIAVKGEAVPLHATEEYTLGGGHRAASRLGRLISGQTAPRYPLNTRVDGLQRQSGPFARGGGLLVRAGIHTLVHPAGSLATTVFLVWTSSIVLYRQ